MRRLIIVGAGGHGKVVAEIANNLGYTLIGFIDDNLEKGSIVYGNYKVLGNVSETKSLIAQGDYFIVAIGNNEFRKKVFESFMKIAIPISIIHPSAVISKNAKIGNGTIVLANSVINAGCSIGEDCIINALSLVDHDSIIGSHCHIAQGTIVGSNCRVRELYSSELGERIKSFSAI